jgi:hypothetical protein
MSRLSITPRLTHSLEELRTDRLGAGGAAGRPDTSLPGDRPLHMEWSLGGRSRCRRLERPHDRTRRPSLSIDLRVRGGVPAPEGTPEPRLLRRKNVAPSAVLAPGMPPGGLELGSRSAVSACAETSRRGGGQRWFCDRYRRTGPLPGDFPGATYPSRRVRASSAEDQIDGLTFLNRS